MRIIYSLNTLGGKNVPGEFFTKLAEISVHYANQTPYEVALYTDVEGYNYIKTTACKFDVVEIVDFEKYEHQAAYWNFGKLQVYALQTQPFLHIDFDVILLPGFTVPEGEIVTEMLRNYSLTEEFKRLRFCDTKNIPAKLVCSGLLGGNKESIDLNIWAELFDHAKRHCKKPIKGSNEFLHLVAVEEFVLSQILHIYGIIPTEINRNSFTHFQGQNKELRFGEIVNLMHNGLQYKSNV